MAAGSAPIRFIRLAAQVHAALRRIAGLRPAPIWLVGGALRDAALGRPVSDIDLACAGARAMAARLAGTFGGTLVTLDEKNAVYRLVLPPSRAGALKQIDVSEIQGSGIATDLARRDFTVNAVALELSVDLPARLSARNLLDPRGGLADLQARLLRCEDGRLLQDDPLRLLRAFRLAAQAGLAIEPATLALVGKHRRLVLKPAAERISAELLALLSLSGAPRWLALMDECGLLTSLFKDLEPARRCAEEYYGPGGVLKHSLDVCSRLDFLLENLRRIYPDLERPLEEHFAARASAGASYRSILMLAALLHDVSKPETLKLLDGRLRFFEHEARGAVRAENILRALRLSREQITAATLMIRHHLRPGHLASLGKPATDKAVYRFFRDLGEHAPGLLALCWGDHSSYMPLDRLKKLLDAACSPRPRAARLARVRPEEARRTVEHLQCVSMLLRRFFDRDNAPVPVRLLDGNEVMKALKIPPGPRVGEILERLREAQAGGEVRSRQEALDFITRMKIEA